MLPHFLRAFAALSPRVFGSNASFLRYGSRSETFKKTDFRTQPYVRIERQIRLAAFYPAMLCSSSCRSRERLNKERAERNRQKGRKSQGPKTVRGREAIDLSKVTHGIRAEIPGDFESQERGKTEGSPRDDSTESGTAGWARDFLCRTDSLGLVAHGQGGKIGNQIHKDEHPTPNAQHSTLNAPSLADGAEAM